MPLKDSPERVPGPSRDTGDAPRIRGFRIEHLLGSGGFAHVWAATREADGASLAIKTIHRQDIAARERLLLEAAALRQIGPPHVPAIYDTGELDDGRPYIVFERIDTPTLDKELGAPLSPERVSALVVPILNTLEAAHARNIVHRDIKPENIFVGGDPISAKLIDFGLAKPTDSVRQSDMETMTGMILGTTTYMAPEQCDGLKDIDERADIYAMGVVVYEMLTGAPPFSGDAAAIRIAHISRRAPLASRRAAVAPAVDAVLARCMAKIREQRYADVASLRTELIAALAQPVSEAARERHSNVKRAVQASMPQALVGVLFFESQVGAARVSRIVEELGGTMASMQRSRYVAVFRATAGRNPLDRAFGAANTLLERAICERVTVDRDRARIVPGRGGTTRLLSANFHRQDRFPSADAPKGVLVTTQMAESLVEPDIIEVPGSADLVQLLEGPDEKRPPESVAEIMVGRESMVRDLVADARSSARDEKAALISIFAESGYGKSTMAGALAVALGREESGFLLLEIRSRQSLGGDGDDTLRVLLCQALELSPIARRDEVQGAFRERLGESDALRLWPAIAQACGWLSPSSPEVAHLRAAPAALRAAAAQALGQTLRSLAEKRPVACIVDDAHFAHDATLDALEYATLSDAGIPLWVCVLAQPEFSHMRPHWGNRSARSRSIELGPLSERDVATLCRKLLHPARDVPDQIIARMVQRTEGNPLFLTQLTRGIKRQGLIRRHQRGEGWYLAADEIDELHELPVIEWLAENYISTLPQELAEHARLLALLPESFTGNEIVGILHELELDGMGEVFPMDAWVANDRLVDHGLLGARGAEAFEFRHALIREEIARRIPDDIRSRIHRAALRYYRNQGEGTNSDVHMPMIAYHASRCGEISLAAAAYFLLAERAKKRHDYLEAERLYSQVIALLPDDDEHARERLRAYDGRALMHYRQSRFDDALVDLRHARAIAAISNDVQMRASLLLDEATVLDWLRDFVNSRARVEEARELLDESTTTTLLRARLALGMGRSFHRRDDLQTARQWLERAANLASALGDDGYETQVIALMLLGYAQSEGGEIVSALESYEECVTLCERRGDKLHLAAALCNRCLLWLKQKSLERAVNDALHSRRLGREIGQLSVEYVTSTNLSDIYFYVGDLTASMQHARRAAELEMLTAHKPEAHLMASRIAFLSDDPGEMRRELDAIHGAEARARSSGNASGLLSPGERVLADMIEAQISGQDPSVWDDIERWGADCCTPVQQVELLEMIGLGLGRLGRNEDGKVALERALEGAKELDHIIEWRIRRALDALGGH